MPEYFYTAKSFKGETKNGVLFAKSKSELAKILHQENYFLISADEENDKKKDKKGIGSININIPFLNKVSLVDKVFFVRNLAVMVDAGISLPRAIKVSANQTKSKKLKSVLLDISDEIIKGKNFSESLVKHSDVFSELFQNMVKVGEETGSLKTVLDSLAQQMEKEHELRSKIKGAMVYPSVVIGAMILVGILMLIMVIPSLAQTFEELEVELPLTTKAVISLGDFFAHNWLLTFLIIAVFIFLFRLLIKTKPGKKALDKFLLKVPIISSIVRKSNAASTVRSLSSLFSSGVPIVRSLEITSKTLGNVFYQEAIIDASEKVKKGGKLSEALAPYENIYPLIVIQMIEVGEETGETSEILEKLAEFFEDEVSRATKNLSSVIEPVLMLIIGAVIGFFAVSMVQPLYSMLGAI